MVVRTPLAGVVSIIFEKASKSRMLITECSTYFVFLNGIKAKVRNFHKCKQEKARECALFYDGHDIRNLARDGSMLAAPSLVQPATGPANPLPPGRLLAILSVSSFYHFFCVIVPATTDGGTVLHPSLFSGGGNLVPFAF
jgi:hypothetical protein